VSQEEFDLFEAAAVLSAQLRAGAAQVVRPEALDPDLPGRLLDHRPDRPSAHALLDLAPFDTSPQQFPVFDPAAVIQALMACFTQTGWRRCATVPELAVALYVKPIIWGMALVYGT
jgi:hypothetical protein